MLFNLYYPVVIAHTDER